jgi:hypothetical protein
MRSLFLILGFIIILNVNAQVKDTIYIDEEVKIISKSEFILKNNSKLYYAFSYKKGDTIANRLFFSYKMDRLKEKSKNQLFSLLSNRNNVDTSKQILIHYRDTLFSKVNYPRNDSIIYTCKHHTNKNTFKSFIRNTKKCVSNKNKENINAYHFFKYNMDSSSALDTKLFFKDPLGIIRKLFHNEDGFHRYWAVLIFPDGRFIVNNRIHLSYHEIDWNQLKKGKEWDKNFTKFKYDYLQLNRNANFYD